MKLAICAIFKDEAPYLAEWVAFHRLLGVEHFLLYDNESSDAWPTVLEAHIAAGHVEVISWPGRPMQLQAYLHGYQTLRERDIRWVAFLDCDEFLWSPLYAHTEQPLHTALERFDDAVAVRAPWLLFGPSGHVAKPAGLVIENYTQRQPSPNVHFKTIANPRNILGVVNPHAFAHTGTVTAAPPDVLCINHYWTKSEEECRARFARGRVDVPLVRQWFEFEHIAPTCNHDDDALAALYGARVRALTEPARDSHSRP